MGAIMFAGCLTMTLLNNSNWLWDPSEIITMTAIIGIFFGLVAIGASFFLKDNN